MKLRLVLLALGMLSYGSTNAVDVREVVIEEGILNKKNKFDLKAVLSNIQKNKISERTWRQLSKFLIDNSLICLEDKSGRLYFIRNNHYEKLGLDASCLMVNRNGVKFYQNNHAGKYYDGLRPSKNHNINKHNEFLSRGFFTDITNRRNGHLDIRARGLKHLSQKEMLDILATAGIERLGFAFEEDLNITIEYNNNNNNSDDFNFSNIINESYSSEDFSSTNNNDNDHVESSFINDHEVSVNASGYFGDISDEISDVDEFDESGYYSDGVTNDNCHYYFSDDNEYLSE